MEKITLIEVKEIPKPARRRGKWIDIVQQFLESDMKRAKIKTDMRARSIYPTIRRAIKVLGKEGTMTAIKRGNDVYLVKR